jgi:hypothetical protein
MNAVRVAAGSLLAALGVVLVFIPLRVAAWLNRPHGTVGELINLRATWGGFVLGIGLFIAVRGAWKPWSVTVVTFLLCIMAAVGAARTVGFFLDGKPDTMQWIWWTAEVVIAAVCVVLLWRWRTG